MPWQNNEGGPWGSGGGGGDKPRNPWGQKPSGGSRGGGGKPSGGGGADFDDFIRRSQERLRAGMGGGGNRGGGGGGTLTGRSMPWTWIILAVLLVWVLATSIYRVEPDERGVELMFGKYHTTTMRVHFFFQRRK